MAGAERLFLVPITVDRRKRLATGADLACKRKVKLVSAKQESNGKKA
jgi:hypothetical protein